MHPTKVVYPQMSALNEAPLQLNLCRSEPPHTIYSYISCKLKSVFSAKNEGDAFTHTDEM